MNGNTDHENFDPYSTEGLATRVGRLTMAVEALLDVVAEMPPGTDPFHSIRIECARRTLDEFGSQRLTR